MTRLAILLLTLTGCAERAIVDNTYVDVVIPAPDLGQPCADLSSAPGCSRCACLGGYVCYALGCDDGGNNVRCQAVPDDGCYNPN